MTLQRFDRRPLTDALLALLAEGTGRAAYDHGAPPDAEPPYLVVWSIPGGGWSGTWASQTEHAEVVYQIDSVGVARRSAEWLADKAAHVMVDREPNGDYTTAFGALEGFAVTARRPQGGPAGVEVDGKPPHEVFSVPERFTLVVVPA